MPSTDIESVDAWPMHHDSEGGVPNLRAQNRLTIYPANSSLFSPGVTRPGRKLLSCTHNIQKPALNQHADNVSHDIVKLSEACILGVLMKVLVCHTLLLHLTWKGFRSSQGSRQVIISHRMIPNEYTSAALL